MSDSSLVKDRLSVVGLKAAMNSSAPSDRWKMPHVVTHTEDENAVAELIEESRAGSRVTAISHGRHEFTAVDSGVAHRLQ